MLRNRGPEKPGRWSRAALDQSGDLGSAEKEQCMVSGNAMTKERLRVERFGPHSCKVVCGRITDPTNPGTQHTQHFMHHLHPKRLAAQLDSLHPSIPCTTTNLHHPQLAPNLLSERFPHQQCHPPSLQTKPQAAMQRNHACTVKRPLSAHAFIRLSGFPKRTHAHPSICVCVAFPFSTIPKAVLAFDVCSYLCYLSRLARSQDLTLPRNKSSNSALCVEIE